MQEIQLSIHLCYCEQDFPEDAIYRKSWIDVFYQTLKILFRQAGLQAPVLSLPENEEASLTCQVYLAILSENFHKNEICQQTMAMASKRQQQEESRVSVFKILPKYISLEQQPLWIRTLPGYEFFEYDPDTEIYQEFRNLQRSIDYRYWLKLDDLVYDLVWKYIKKEKEIKASIYLASSTIDLSGAREEIKRNLKHWGYQVLPLRPYDKTDEEALAIAIKENMASCMLSIHTFGEVYGDVVNDMGSSLAVLENELAAEQSISSGLQRLIWLPKAQEVMETKQLAYIEYIKSHRSMRVHTECLETRFEHFKDYIHQQLLEIEHPKSVETKQYVFGIMASTEVNWEPLRQWAQTKNWRFYTFDQQSDWVMTQALMGNAHAVVLATEGGKAEWLSYWSRALLKIVGYREQKDAPKLFWLKSQQVLDVTLPSFIHQIDNMSEVSQYLTKSLNAV